MPFYFKYLHFYNKHFNKYISPFQTRQELSQQLAISRELTQKIKQTGDSDEDEEENQVPLVLSKEDAENPWMNGVKTESEVNDFIQSYRKYWDQKHKEEEGKKVSSIDGQSTSANKSMSLENKSQKQISNEASTGKHFYFYYLFQVFIVKIFQLLLAFTPIIFIEQFR